MNKPISFYQTAIVASALIFMSTGLGSSEKEEKEKILSEKIYRELDWKELAPDTESEDKLIAKYQPLIWMVRK